MDAVQFISAPASAAAPSRIVARLGGIDSIRAICAGTVVLGHLGLFSDATVHGHGWLTLAGRITPLLFNAPAAVIVFFIISGFVIHLPFHGGRAPDIPSFLTRRLVRVVLPSLIAFVLATYALRNNGGILDVIWSIYCEIIYYVLYPVLRRIALRVGWGRMVIVTYVVSVILPLAQLHLLVEANNSYTALGNAQTWIIGLPCWLMGCWLAENSDRFKPLSLGRLWQFRIGIYVLAEVLRTVKFHVHSPFASNVFMLNLFAFPACAWLGYEIAHFRTVKASKLLEWMGGWSYSLYLVHPMSVPLLAVLHFALLNTLIDHFHPFLPLLAAVFSYIYFLVIENPSHKLAKALSRAVARKPAPAEKG